MRALRYIERYRAKIRLMRKREFDKVERKTKVVKIQLKKAS